MNVDREFVPPEEATPPFFAGIDLGGTNIKVGLLDDDGRTLAYRSIPTEVQNGPEDGARRMAEAISAAAAEAGLSIDDVARVGLATPGTMDIPAGMLLHLVNLPGWDDFPIRDRVAAHCGRPVSFANDAGAAAYGEFWMGSGSKFRSMILLTLGTGIGGGIIIGDLSIDGEHSHGAECGHTIIDYNDSARVCSCGAHGHLEAYTSATAVVARTREALLAGRESALPARLDAGEPLTPMLIADAAAGGDPLADEIVMETARYLGIGITTLVHTIDPDGVLLGGAMTFGRNESELGQRFLERVREEFRSRAFPVLAEQVTIDYASLGGDAGFIGAAGIARVAHR